MINVLNFRLPNATPGYYLKFGVYQKYLLLPNNTSFYIFSLQHAKIIREIKIKLKNPISSIEYILLNNGVKIFLVLSKKGELYLKADDQGFK